MKSRFFGVRGLAEAVRNELQEFHITSTKRNVSEVPDERTIRFYLTKGLLPSAAEKVGVTWIFERRHVLSLLAIKKLQAEGTPIAFIKTILADKSEKELEEFLNQDIRTKLVTDQKQLVRYKKMSSEELAEEFGEQVQQIESGPAEKKSAAEYLKSLLFEKSPSNPESRRLSSLRGTPDSRETPDAGRTTWRRYEIVSGLEIHVSEAYEPPKKHEASGLLDQIAKLIGIESDAD